MAAEDAPPPQAAQPRPSLYSDLIGEAITVVLIISNIAYLIWAGTRPGNDTPTEGIWWEVQTDWAPLGSILLVLFPTIYSIGIIPGAFGSAVQVGRIKQLISYKPRLRWLIAAAFALAIPVLDQPLLANVIRPAFGIADGNGVRWVRDARILQAARWSQTRKVLLRCEIASSKGHENLEVYVSFVGGRQMNLNYELNPYDPQKLGTWLAEAGPMIEQAKAAATPNRVVHRVDNACLRKVSDGLSAESVQQLSEIFERPPSHFGR